MKLAIGIILLLVALWFLYGTIRMWPLGRYRPRMLWPSTRADIVRGVFLVVANCVTGVALIRGASWWWLLVAVLAIVAWALIEGVVRRRRLEEAVLIEAKGDIGLQGNYEMATIRRVWENALSEESLSILSIGSAKEAKEIIGSFMMPDKINPLSFSDNCEALLRQGMPSLRDIADSEKNPQPTPSVSRFIAVMDRPVGMPLWFIAAYPDVLLWYDNQVGEYMKAHRPDRDSLTVFSAKLFGLDPTDPNLEKKLGDSMDKEGKFRPNILRDLVQSYKDKTGKELETVAKSKWHN